MADLEEVGMMLRGCLSQRDIESLTHVEKKLLVEHLQTVPWGAVVGATSGLLEHLEVQLRNVEANLHAIISGSAVVDFVLLKSLATSLRRIERLARAAGIEPGKAWRLRDRRHEELAASTAQRTAGIEARLRQAQPPPRHIQPIVNLDKTETILAMIPAPRVWLVWNTGTAEEPCYRRQRAHLWTLVRTIDGEEEVRPVIDESQRYFAEPGFDIMSDEQCDCDEPRIIESWVPFCTWCGREWRHQSGSAC